MKPQLPKPTLLMCVMPNDYRYGDVVGYTTVQVLAFAKVCIEHEREQCVKLKGDAKMSFPCNEVEDGMGFSGVVESSKERREKDAFNRIYEAGRLRGRLEALAEAMTECTKIERRENNSVGARDCSEIRKALDIMHLDTLRKMSGLPNVELTG